MKNNISWESFYFKDVSVLDNLSCLRILKDEEISRFFSFWRFSANFYSQSYSFTLSMLITFEFSSTGFLLSIFYYIQCLSFFHYFSINFFFYFDTLFYCEIAFFFLFKNHWCCVAWVLHAKKWLSLDFIFQGQPETYTVLPLKAGDKRKSSKESHKTKHTLSEK